MSTSAADTNINPINNTIRIIKGILYLLSALVPLSALRGFIVETQPAGLLMVLKNNLFSAFGITALLGIGTIVMLLGKGEKTAYHQTLSIGALAGVGYCLVTALLWRFGLWPIASGDVWFIPLLLLIYFVFFFAYQHMTLSHLLVSWKPATILLVILVTITSLLHTVT